MKKEEKQLLLQQAQAGDIRAFHELFSEFQAQLKSYLYRLLANRDDTEDMAHDVFITSFENIKSFRQEAKLKSWVFTIATNMARRKLKRENQWMINTMELTREYAHESNDVMDLLHKTNELSPQGIYEIREHIDYCFTCVTKMLPLKQQIALVLVDIYDFKIAEASDIMGVKLGAFKHLLRNARQKMVQIFDHNCALVNKNGVCNQCSALNGRFNPKQDHQAKLMQIKWVKEQEKYDTAQLLQLRTLLVKEIDPLKADGTDLHDLFLQLNKKVNQPENKTN